jgi:hypothetical protein
MFIKPIWYGSFYLKSYFKNIDKKKLSIYHIQRIDNENKRQVRSWVCLGDHFLLNYMFPHYYGSTALLKRTSCLIIRASHCFV